MDGIAMVKRVDAVVRKNDKHILHRKKHFIKTKHNEKQTCTTKCDIFTLYVTIIYVVTGNSNLQIYMQYLCNILNS